MRRLGYTSTIVECSHFSFTCARIQSGHQLIDRSFTTPFCSLGKSDIGQLQLLAIVCPKILKIMPVDAYNASIIFKCLHTPIVLKIMPA